MITGCSDASHGVLDNQQSESPLCMIVVSRNVTGANVQMQHDAVMHCSGITSANAMCTLRLHCTLVAVILSDLTVSPRILMFFGDFLSSISARNVVEAIPLDFLQPSSIHNFHGTMAVL